jgi:hypothetical protein
MSATTGLTVVTGAYELLQVIATGDPLPSALLATGFRRLNMLIGTWATMPLTIPVIARETFPVLGGTKGGPANPYTVGPGGDLNTPRPLTLTGVGLVMFPGLVNEVEIPRALYTDDMYQADQLKNLQNTLFTGAYYNPTFQGGFGSLSLWPVATDTSNQIAIYRPQQLAPFTTPTAIYYLPEGADEALEYNLALRLADPGAVPAERLANIQQIARTSLASFKRSNTQIYDMPVDAAFTQNNYTRRTGYNIVTGTGG